MAKPLKIWSGSEWVDVAISVPNTDIYATNASLSAHESDRTNVHGIADTNELATKSYADNAASSAAASLVDSAPSTLDTLNELAAALGDDQNFATTVTNSIASKQDSIPLQSSAPISPSSGDLWVDNTDTAKPVLKVYDASSWITAGSSITADDDQIILASRIFS